MTWLLLCSKPSSEKKVADFATRIGGATVFYPTIARVARHARQSVEKVYPFFPRYLFVQEGSAHPSSLRHLPGVARFVMVADGYARLDDDVIEALRERADEDGHIRPPPPEPIRYKPGDNVKVHTLDGFVGMFLRMRGEDRVVVLLSMFNRQFEQTLGVHQIEKLAA